MTKIADLLDRDFSKPIEEIIKVNNADEETVYTELTEYVATDRIKAEYESILKAIANSRTTPTEAIGVWVSGFFGSGKSSFAKNLGYVLANKTVLGKSSSDLFSDQLNHDRITDYLKLLNQSLPCEVFMFDVQVDRSVRTEEQIAEVMYRVLLRDLGYAEEYDLAELEIELENEGNGPAWSSGTRRERIQSGRNQRVRVAHQQHISGCVDRDLEQRRDLLRERRSR